MNLATNLFAVLILLVVDADEAVATSLRESQLKKFALDNGFVRSEETWAEYNLELVSIGKEVFESKLLSSNRDIACASCHLDRFGSSDGLPVAIGVAGKSFGLERVKSDGDILPRNALPLWGRGGKGFTTMFWDGRVQISMDGSLHSQFGSLAPSDDPLVVAAHLPPLELGEMADIGLEGESTYQQEDVDAAYLFGETIAVRFREASSIVTRMAAIKNIDAASVGFSDIVSAAAHFISYNYRLKPTRFERFVFDNGPLTDSELNGGLIFYGSGQCVLCHYGPYFSDFDFHVIPMPQLGFGANGFGVDYGRYNVTQDPQDLFAFRTPPLINVGKTSPYSHSGSVADLKSAILYHIDPLAIQNDFFASRDDRQRYARQLGLWSRSFPMTVNISEDDLGDIVSFLKALEYNSEYPVLEIK